MLKSEAAAYLAGVTQTEGAEASAPTNLHVITGEVGEASADGKTLVKIDGLMFSESDDQFIEVDALGGLEEGDIATIVLTGEQGHAMTPLALGSIGSVDRITVRIAAIEADYIKVEQLDAAKARIGELEADHVSVDDFNAATGRIGTLETTRATITDLNAATARIGTLEADHVSTDDFSAATARIGTLETNTADIGTIRANSAKVQNLTAAELEADHATVGSLSTNYAHITNGVIDNATIGYADVNNLSAHYAEIQNGKINSALIDTAAIVDEQVFTVTGNKATLAQIDASKINVLNLKAKDIEVERINGQPVTNKTLVDALSQHETDISGLDTKIDNEVEALNDRIDGAIETFTGTVVPTLSNTPASSWNTTKLKDQHVGDVYYVVNSQSAQNGYCYRFTKSGSTYSWQLIKDSDVTAALSRLQTAEGKIGDIEQFDVTVGSFMTNTDDEISSLKAKDTKLETSIGDKVSTSTFNTVSQKVDTNEANITSMSTVLTNNGLTSSTNITNTVNTVKQTADTNTSNISSLQTTVSGHTTTIQQHTTSIRQNTDAIALKANSSDVYTKTSVDGKITQEVSDRNAAITAKANEITSTVSQTYTTKEEFDNLEIGGRNLALNTSGVIVDRTETPDGSRYEYFYFDLGRALPFGAGTPIVISFDLYMPIKSSSPRFLVYNTNCKGPHQTLLDIDVLSGKNLPVGSVVDERIVIETSVYADRSDSTLPNDYLEFYSTYGSNNYYRIANLKLEKGNKVTDWTPAPEDTTDAIESAKAEIKVTTDAISSTVEKVSSVKYLVSSNNSALSNIKAWATEGYTDNWSVLSGTTGDLRVGDTVYLQYGDNTRGCKVYIKGTVNSFTNASVNFTSHGYEDVLPVETIKSTINQSSDSVKIQARHVEIDGAAVFNAAKSKLDAAYDAKGAAATVQNNLNNLEIGGRNLLLATGTTQSKTMPAVAAGSYTTWDPYKLVGAYNTLGLSAGDSITISFDWSVTGAAANSTIKIGTNVDPWEYFGVLVTFAAGASSGHVTKTYTVTSKLASCAGTTLRARIDAVGTAITTSMVITLSNVKLEKGNKATDWSPAPEDQTAYVDAIQVGGRNLLTDSDDITKCFDSSSNITSIVGGKADPDGGNGAYLITPNTTNWWAGPRGARLRLTKLDVSYTFSIWLRADNATQCQMCCRYMDSTPYSSNATRVNINVTTEWKRFFISAPLKQVQTGDSVWIGYLSTTPLYVYHPMVEMSSTPSDWSPAPEDIEANAVKRTQRIWYRTNGSSAPSTPGTASSNWVTKADDGNDAWTKMHVAISSTHKYIYTCEQYEMANGTVGYTSVLLDNTITVIDGGNIITGSVTANKLNAANINASKTLTVGAMTDAAASSILNSNVPQYRVVTTSYSYTLAQWLTYAAEGYTGSWATGTSGQGVRAGDTVMLKGTNRDNGSAVYVLMTVNTLNSSGAISNATSHGLIDPTAGQRADSIQVGGRNLLPKTGSANGYYANTVPSGNHLTIVNDDGECYENSVTSTSAGIPMSSNVALVGLESGSEYTISMMVKSTVARRFGLQLRKNNNGADGGEYVYQPGVNVAANTWTRLTYSFTGPSDALVYARLYVAAGTACTVRMRELQLERGNKVTDWTPAPEDQTDTVDQTYVQNLTPYFQMDMSNQADEYWANLTYERFSRLDDGWAHFEYTNSGTKTENNFIKLTLLDFLEPGGKYTLLAEFKNVSISADGGFFYSQQGSDVQVWGAAEFCGFAITNAEIRALSGGAGAFYKTLTLLTADSKDPSGTVRGSLPKTSFMSINQQVQAGQTVSYDLRLSLYADGYTGTYKPYVGSQLYATGKSLSDSQDFLDERIDGLDERTTGVETSLETTSGNLTAVDERLKALDKQYTDEKNQRDQWMNFTSSQGLSIGDKDSTFKTVVTSTSMEFKNGDATLAEASGTEFIANIMRSEELHIGKWMWTKRNEGNNLSLKWVG